jgi:2,4-dienoyl-CoA reductase-like NADH-dependent reductase (Old Yellow Enzyme family)
MTAPLSTPLVLPCGTVLKNRIAKAAMSECLATFERSDPSHALVRLYERFSAGGAGLLITGNVMVSADGVRVRQRRVSARCIVGRRL